MTRGDPGIRRILVALDASADSAAALEAAVALAARLEAELTGLFVEDIEVVRAAGLPFAREIRVFQHAPRSINAAELEAQLLARARAIERTFAHSAGEADVRFRFRRVRGRVDAEVLAATGDVDLVVLGRAGHSPLARRRLGSTARAMLARGSRPVLLLGRRVQFREPVFAVFDGSEAGLRALAVAVDLARGGPQPLHVLVTADSAARVAALEVEARRALSPGAGAPVVHRIVGADSARLAEIACRAGAGVLVAPASDPTLDAAALPDALDAAGCPLLLVR